MGEIQETNIKFKNMVRQKSQYLYGLPMRTRQGTLKKPQEGKVLSLHVHDIRDCVI